MITEEEQKRYHRQILMLGEAGQEKLKAARVLIAGAGGLGTVISLYLAAAGVGPLRIVDCDVVEASNLNRQILHWGGDIGRPKTASASEKLAALNPLIRVEEVAGRIDETSIDAITKECDLIVDAMDNFPTRYLLNRTAVRKGIPFIHGAVRGLFGQATTVLPGKTPCLRCIFPRKPAAGGLPDHRGDLRRHRFHRGDGGDQASHRPGRTAGRAPFHLGRHGGERRFDRRGTESGMPGLRACGTRRNRTMKITFRTFADFREIIGARELELSLREGETLGGLLKDLCNAYPRLQGKLFDASGKIKPYILILKNGRNIDSLQHLDTIIDADDVISVFPPVAGG